jgi:hypothetical protein
MAIGDDANAAGYLLVPSSGPDGLVKDGAKEINRTRDYIAQVKVTVPTSKSAFRTASGITAGTGDPTGGSDGDVYFKIIG